MSYILNIPLDTRDIICNADDIWWYLEIKLDEHLSFIDNIASVCTDEENYLHNEML